MKKLSVFTFDPAGPALPADVARMYAPLAMTSESGESDWKEQAGRVEVMADGLSPNAVLLANCEHYTDNTVAAIGCARACRRGNEFVRFGCYHPAVNGGTYYDVAGSNGRNNTAARDAKVISDEQQQAAVAELSPFVDVWFLDMFSAEDGGDANAPGLVRLLGRDSAASREIVFGRRVQAVAHTGKPWYGVLGVVAVPGKKDQARAMVVQGGTEFSAETLYADAAWCFKNGAEGVVVMAFDPCRRNGVDKTGAVVVTPEVVKALRGIGKDF